MHPSNASFQSLQLMGWGLFFAANTFFRAIEDTFTPKDMVLSFTFAMSGLCITWVMRTLYLSRFIQALEAKLMFLACTVICLIAAIIMTCASALFVITYAWLTTSPFPTMTVDFYLTNFSSIIMILCIWSLLYFMIRYLRQFRHTEIEKLKLEANLKDAQLNTLKGQINPHFMFNSLNNLRALMLENTGAAREGITNLAEFLRYSLTSELKDKVTLEEELQVVEDFVSLAKIQYEGRLTFIVDIDASSKQCLIPVMSLQMMTENAIKHGIAEQVNGGELSISTSVTASTLTIAVSNPGQLMSKGRNYAIKPDSADVGVNNIHKRIHLLYGGKGKFELNQNGEQVTATLILPLEYTS